MRGEEEKIKNEQTLLLENIASLLYTIYANRSSSSGTLNFHSRLSPLTCAHLCFIPFFKPIIKTTNIPLN
jgi:hypothetical protein